ncbi:hypothetical protein L5515_004664 [Caenorhabditis briggsae]|uniref:ubiquitinyl hydrolase 1 n=1 Tax=Caenorhabditis briggsae TaxID=6238 RepID=A0AAE9JBE0_CAEBR|nr:hypothetical protein L5515_004664 [Caenorhabditis briggsae]
MISFVKRSKPPYFRMPGEFESVPELSAGSHQFRNPLDDFMGPTQLRNSFNDLNNHGFEFLGQSNTNSSSSSNVRYTNSKNRESYLDQNIPVGNLLDGFDFIEKPSVPYKETLVDVSDSRTKLDRDLNEEGLIVALLQRKINGLYFKKSHEEYEEPRVFEIPAGTMVREMADDDWKIPELNEWYSKNRLNRMQEGIATPMEIQELDCNPRICSMVTRTDVMRISQDQAIHLLSVKPENRLELYHNIERFNFIVNLRVGNRVEVDVDDTMRRVPAKVSWIGERQQEPGMWYNVDFDTNASQWPPNSYSSHDRLNRHFDTNWNLDMSGSSSVAASNSRLYYSPNQMHMPMKGGGVSALYDNRRLVHYNGAEESYRNSAYPKPPPSQERIIPVTRQQAEFERPSRAMRPPEPDYNTYSNHHHPLPPAPPVAPRTSHSSSLNSYVGQPSRSKSVHTMQRNLYHRQHIAEQNEPVESDQLGFRVGDQCIWNNNGVEERGIIKFIGFLKGHKTLYAGVEFKNQIGAGTGVFNKEQLFHSKDGHAGFVELSTLESTSSTSSSSSSSAQHRRRLSSSRSQQMPAASGTSISVPVNVRHNINGKQASSESLSDPPPPPYAPPSPPRASSAAAAHQQPPPLPPKPIAHVEDYLIESYDIGSHVVVAHLGAQRNGVVRWLGNEVDEQGERLVRSAIVQLDDDVPTAWRRSNEAITYCGSPVTGGVLVPVQALRHNRAASSSSGHSVPMSSNYPTSHNTINRRTEEFGSMDSGVEKHHCGPAKDIQQLVGRQKGIQGYCNSCYLDATLYAMFVQSTFFDFLLEKSIKGNEKASQFQKILAQEIVFPLRKVHYVRADHVMKLRKLLAELMPHVTGLTNEEKDPEEILGFIFSEIFHAEPFIKLIGQNRAKDSQYLVPIVVDDWQGGAATSQHLLERHMRSAQVTFAKSPPVLIMQLPRYGQQKVFDKILPLETIDITPFVAGAVPACTSCGACSEVYCPTCFLTRRVFYSEIIFCRKCFHHSHLLPEIQDHQSRDLFPPAKPVKKPHSHKMVLSAVLCIETSHYVAYVRSSTNQWIFFDSMADREGLSDGFNVPVARECGNMSDWLSLQGWNRLKDADETGQIKAMFGKAALDPLVGRLLSDSYICFYEDASATCPSSSSNLISTFKNMMN